MILTCTKQNDYEQKHFFALLQDAQRQALRTQGSKECSRLAQHTEKAITTFCQMLALQSTDFGRNVIFHDIGGIHSQQLSYIAEGMVDVHETTGAEIAQIIQAVLWLSESYLYWYQSQNTRDFSQSFTIDIVPPNEVIEQMCDLLRLIFPTQSRQTEIIFTINKSIENLLTSVHLGTLYTFLQSCLLNSNTHGKATKLCLRVQEEDNLIKLVVDDNGQGINTQKLGDNWQELIFMPKVSAGGGSGIGLSCMPKRFAMFGGSIKAQAHGDLGGAQFMVTMPKVDLDISKF